MLFCIIVCQLLFVGYLFSLTLITVYYLIYKSCIDVYKKISEWPKCIEISSKKLEPHRVPTYLYELSSLFHSYWNMGKEDKTKRFISEDKKISDEKLVLLKSVSNTIKTGMNLVGVSTPDKM